jgi:predicted regulator of Ras-like GTPase activity (Roadblock/LC7/MglB family)
MPDSRRTILGALRDVGGIQGSFAIDRSGALIAKDLPAVFDDGLFAVVGPRIARLHDTLALDGEKPANVVIRFSEHRLHLRPTRFGFVGVLSDAGINLSALKMAVSLVARRLESEIADASGPPSLSRSDPLPFDLKRTLPSEELANPLPVTAAEPPPSPSSRQGMTYRGRRVQ